MQETNGSLSLFHNSMQRCMIKPLHQLQTSITDDRHSIPPLNSCKLISGGKEVVGDRREKALIIPVFLLFPYSFRSSFPPTSLYFSLHQIFTNFPVFSPIHLSFHCFYTFLLYSFSLFTSLWPSHTKPLPFSMSVHVWVCICIKDREKVCYASVSINATDTNKLSSLC